MPLGSTGTVALLVRRLAHPFVQATTVLAMLFSWQPWAPSERRGDRTLAGVTLWVAVPMVDWLTRG